MFYPTRSYVCRLDEIIVFRQLTKGEVKQIADIMLGEVFKRAEEKEIKIDVTERFKVLFVDCFLFYVYLLPLTTFNSLCVFHFWALPLA